MSETKFTKGEWFTKDGSEFGGIKSVMVFYPHGFLTSAKFIKIDESQKDGESWLDMRLRTDVDRKNAAIESNANMHLIAAAPEMYKMLEDLSSQLTDINAHGHVNEVDKLLAKARGEKV